MDFKIYIEREYSNEWMQKYFDGKEYISLEDVFTLLEELNHENEKLKKQIEDIKQDIEDNYKPISKYQQYGISEDNFH